jgi:hypothetical protein
MVAENKKEKTQEVMQTTFLKIPNHSCFLRTETTGQQNPYKHTCTRKGSIANRIIDKLITNH